MARGLSLHEQAFPTMTRPGEWVLNFARRRDWAWNSLNIHVWGAAFAAKKYCEAVLADDEWIWELNPDGTESNDSLVSSSGIRISTNSTSTRHLREVMEHEYSIAEMGWDLPYPYPQMAAKWRARRLWEDLRSASQEPRRRGVPRASRSGLVTIQTIAEEYGMTPRDARGILRKAKVPKPACGWAWKPDDVQPIRDLMEKNK